MALIVNVSKTSVTKANMKGLYNATVTMEVVDGGPGPGFSRTFTEQFKQADAKPDLLATSIARTELLFKADMEQAIAAYEETQELFKLKQFDNLVTSLQADVQAGLEA